HLSPECPLLLLTTDPHPHLHRPHLHKHMEEQVCVKAPPTLQQQNHKEEESPPRTGFQKCPIATLRCFADEFSVLCEEMKVSGLKCTQQRISPSLRNMADKFNKVNNYTITITITITTSDCRLCELHPEESPKRFLGVLQKTICTVCRMKPQGSFCSGCSGELKARSHECSGCFCTNWKKVRISPDRKSKVLWV
uniref:Uncharacterized protein n=1 Tax=Xiphophorus couchianus TaxID=32473 RepID=A0A3B5M2B7_9TELE